MTELRVKPGRDPNRRGDQAQVKQALVTGQTWALTYLLARVKDRWPYDNYQLPENLEIFEFTLKGLLRLEMLTVGGVYKGWRRMFGSNTKAHDISTWRSRVLLKAFENLQGAQDYIAADPLWGWTGQSLSLRPNLPAQNWYTVLQIQDLWLPDGQTRWSQVLAGFLLQESRALELVGIGDVLSPIKGGSDA